MLNSLPHNTALSKHEYKKYARHLILKNMGINGQKRLKEASILFIGAGGLASGALIYLASSGIGSIGIIDNDIVSLSNLHRQILYNSNDIHKLKVEAAKTKILEINPLCKFKNYSQRLSSNNAIDLIKNYDLIIDTSDNFETRYIIDNTCYQLHKVHIYGAVQNFEGQLSVFNYKGGPRYSDLYPTKLQLTSNNCNNIGILGILPGIIGLLQATEAIKIILGTGNIINGYILVYNAIDNSFKKFKIKTSSQNESINTTNKSLKENPRFISYENLHKVTQNNRIIFIDVRQNIEFKKSHIKNSINIPIQYLKNKNSLEFLKHTYTCLNRKLIVHCSSKSRAIIASQILYKNNIQHYILEKGFDIR